MYELALLLSKPVGLMLDVGTFLNILDCISDPMLPRSHYDDAYEIVVAWQRVSEIVEAMSKFSRCSTGCWQSSIIAVVKYVAVFYVEIFVAITTRMIAKFEENGKPHWRREIYGDGTSRVFSCLSHNIFNMTCKTDKELHWDSHWALTTKPNIRRKMEGIDEQRKKQANTQTQEKKCK
jgi:hypothetical protein